jgi:hypothetical protein
MAYLSYISDQALYDIVFEILEKGFNKKMTVNQSFNDNVIDPFATLFDAAISGFDHDTWKEAEMVRQCQKSLANAIGTLHQKVLGAVVDWQDMGTGGELDLHSAKHKIIAEIKNKHNTLTGGRLADEYHSLHDKVSKKASQFYGYTVYFVTIIPKKPKRFYNKFTPSDRSVGQKVAASESVRKCDGATFYHLVTGDKNALSDFYAALPLVIEDIAEKLLGKPLIIKDKVKFASYFNIAFE